LIRFGGDRSHRGRVLIERVVDSVLVIIGDVVPNQTAKMNLIEDNHMVEKLSSTASNPAFRDSIGVSAQQHPIVTMKIESSKSHTRFILSSGPLLSW
jgi:hypothetical protein